MTVHQDTIRSPRAGDYARWDATGTRVLCGRRQDDGTRCPTVLALLDAGTIFGRPYRLLRFPHDAFIEQNGVWRVTTAAKLRQQQGWEPRTQGGIGPQRVTAAGSAGVGLIVPALPAIFRCPNPTCKNKRILDAAVLNVESGAEHGAWVAQQLTPVQGYPEKGIYFL
jgi:hypothetical protein